jgi:hypothetical protein
MQTCMAALRPGGGAPVTGVHLSQFDGNLAAIACADHSAYVFDLRSMGQPLWQLAGHGRAVSYVRWLGIDRLVSASTDASLALWQLPGAAQQQTSGQPVWKRRGEVLEQPWRRLSGHRNSKNFVGLSVRPEGGLVACGSEAPACYAYAHARSAPLATHHFAPLRWPGQGLAGSGGDSGNGSLQMDTDGLDPPPAGQFCSAVCWQPATARLGGAPLLAAATSDGDVRVLELRHTPAPPINA